MGTPPPPLSKFTPAERALVRRLTTPLKVQRWLETLPYNREKEGLAIRSFRGVVRDETAHCLEGAVAAAVILEQHGSPPLAVSIDSRDGLGHVVILYRRSFWPGLRKGEPDRWGGVATSRDPGLNGRRPVFRTVRDLVWSYFDAYIDKTGEITGYAVVDLSEALPRGWRLSARNLWRVERALIEAKHAKIRGSRARVRRWRKWYAEYLRRSGGTKPDRYPGHERWL